MKVDPRFALAMEEVEGQKSLRFTCVSDLKMEEEVCILASVSLGELCDLAGVPTASRGSLLDRAKSLVFSNGWQSWSFGGELGPGERVRRSFFLDARNLMTDRPGPLAARGEILSHFLTWVRSGDCRLVLASRGSPDLALPPLSFRFDRRGRGLSIEALAGGASFSAGELVAELRLFHREGYFQAKDALRAAFRAYGHFDRLAFLGHGGSLVPGGYESWYNHYTAIDERLITADLDHIGANDNLINLYYLKRGKPTVFQIDDGWEAAVGQWEADRAKFPGGMEALASKIESRGMIPGLWLAPFLVTKSCALWRDRPEWLLRDGRGRPVTAGWNPGWDGTFYCLDLSLPDVEEHLAGVFEKVVEEWGYRYLKLDFLYAGFLRGERARGGAAYAHYDRVLHRITSRLSDRKGRPVAWLGCGAPFEPSFRHFPLMRIGADTKEAWDWPALRLLGHQGRPGAYVNATHTIGRAMLDGTVFVNDPDVVFCRTARMGLSEREKELVALLDFVLASQIMFSDDCRDFGEKGEVDFTSRIVGLYDSLEGGENGAERLERDVYSIFSRDGRLSGLANLSGRPYDAGRGRFDPAQALVIHASRGSKGGAEGSLLFEPHSLSLFRR